MARAQRYIQAFLELVRVRGAFNSLEALQEPHNDVRRLGERELFCIWN